MLRMSSFVHKNVNKQPRRNIRTSIYKVSIPQFPVLRKYVKRGYNVYLTRGGTTRTVINMC